MDLFEHFILHGMTPDALDSIAPLAANRPQAEELLGVEPLAEYLSLEDSGGQVLDFWLLLLFLHFY